MGLYLEAACKRKIWSRCLVSNSSARPSIINDIEAVRFCAFSPPGSPLIDMVSWFFLGACIIWNSVLPGRFMVD